MAYTSAYIHADRLQSTSRKCHRNFACHGRNLSAGKVPFRMHTKNVPTIKLYYFSCNCNSHVLNGRLSPCDFRNLCETGEKIKLPKYFRNDKKTQPDAFHRNVGTFSDNSRVSGSSFISALFKHINWSKRGEYSSWNVHNGLRFSFHIRQPDDAVFYKTI